MEIAMSAAAPDPNLILLYVESAPESAAFYERLLGRPPVESSATFAMFLLREGTMLGLWKHANIEPPASAKGGGAEIAFTVADAAAADAVHADWSKRGLKIAQAPTDMDFGRTFVALDPDGHRLRVFAPAGP
jgi:predicted enzyme related to lactoylglutathione lyase